MTSSNPMSLFQVFSDKMSELTIHKVYNCTACINIEHLKLKMVLHSGPAAFYQVNGQKSRRQSAGGRPKAGPDQRNHWPW